MFKKFTCGVLLLGLGSLFSSCSEESSKPTAPTPEEEAQKAEEIAKEEIKVTDWEAEAAKPNGPTKDVLAKVALPSAGFYAEKFNLEIPAPAFGGEVRCTFDGSEPTLDLAPVDTAVSVEKNLVARCTEFLGDSAVAKSVETYFIGESVAMPVVAVTVPPWYYTDILKAKPCKPDPCKNADFWLDTAVVAHVEYFPDGSSTKEKAFEIDAEASIMGGYSRNQKKKSVSLNMKKKIQKGHFRYPLFDTRADHKKFKGFILRNNGNRFVSDYIEDAMATSLLEGTHVDYQRSRQVVVFYNGNYYGIHDMREKLNEHFVETNYGIDADKVDFIKHVNKSVEASGGSEEGYLNLLSYVYNSDLSGENNEAYSALKKIMDMQSYVEYMAAEIYFHNGDWPNNNLRAWRSGTQPWKFVAYDTDHGFDWMWGAGSFKQSTNMFTWIKNGGSGSCAQSDDVMCFQNMFVKLSTNPDFNRAFINRAAVLYSSYINGNKVTAAVDKMVASIPKDEYKRDDKKFPRADLYYNNSCGGGFEWDGDCLVTWSKNRDFDIRDEYRMEYSLGADITVGIGASGNGRVLLDGMELPSREYAGTFFEGNAMELTAVGEGTFVGWEDGSTDNPRMVQPVDGAAYIATFQ